MAFHLTKPQVWGVMPCCQVTTSVCQFYGFYKTNQLWVKFLPKWLWVYEIFSKKPIGFRVESNFVTNGFRSEKFSFYKNLVFWVGFSLSRGMVQKLIFKWLWFFWILVFLKCFHQAPLISQWVPRVPKMFFKEMLWRYSVYCVIHIN